MYVAVPETDTSHQKDQNDQDTTGIGPAETDQDHVMQEQIIFADLCRIDTTADLADHDRILLTAASERALAEDLSHHANVVYIEKMCR